MMNDLPQQPTRGGRKGINWLRARTMYLAGENLTNVARAIGVRRQTVSERAAAENWRALRDANQAETGRKLIEQAVDDNVTVLKRHDAIGAKLLDAAEKRIDEMLASGASVSLKQLRDASATAASAAELQRSARAIGSNDSFINKNKDGFTVTLRRGVDSAAFDIIAKALGSQEAAQQAIRAAQQTDVADTA